MLRIAGVIALVLSGVLATVLFLQVQRLQRTGVAETYHSAAFLQVRYDTGPDTTAHFVRENPASFPAEYVVNAADRNIGLLFVMNAELRGIANEAPVTVTHRWVAFRGVRWSFASTEIESGGQVYVYDRSRAAFLGSLGLISAAPVLCWLPFALGAWVLRKSRKEPEP